ncbi:histidine phosphatase family protein [Streptomyces finlayi]|uniref:Histidine phosphatase family protein n=2 Tax=Streptomyces finlayi TaxID=67296 RepID=A0A7G7BUK5_9ACTN|nr:histidine phosphatase family protein [Streptomyces finlayi]
MLIAPAMNAALREARFEGDAPLDEAGVRRARAAADRVPEADLWVSGTSERCLRTADALDVHPTPEPALADWDMGRWRGKRLSDVSDGEAEAVAAWLTDPTAAPHGGESLLDLSARVGSWLDGLEEGSGRVLAIVEPAVVRAAVVHGLGLAAAGFWRLDVAPLALTELSGREGRWNLKCGQVL